MKAKTKVQTFNLLEMMLKQIKDLSNLASDFRVNLSRETNDMIENILRIESEFDKYDEKTLIDKITSLRKDIHKIDHLIYLFHFRASIIKRAMEISITNLIKDIEGENNGKK